jgi:enoyl-CoA hydratase/3-hydroxyacyl-CoA dehydrogenase
MADWEDVEEGLAYLADVVLPTIDALRAHPKPTVAFVDGIAAGTGCELVLLSDMAVATEASRFGQPESTIGVLPPIWLTHGVTSVGKKKLLEIALTGDFLSAREAEEIGLVNYSVSDDQAWDVARELVHSTTASAPGATTSVIDLWHGLEDDLVGVWFEDAASEFAERVQTEESTHGISAFFSDSSPRWEY